MLLLVQPAVCQEDTSRSDPPAGGEVTDDQGAFIRAPSEKSEGLEEKQLSRDDPFGLAGFLKTLAALGLVIVLILGAGLLLRRYGTVLQGGGSGAIELVASKAVGPKSRLLLVRFGKRLLLLGSGPGGLSMLCEAGDSDEEAEVHADEGSQT